MIFAGRGKAALPGGAAIRLSERPPGESALLLVQPGSDVPIERTLREALGASPRIDVVEDPTGVMHEAVPHETLLLSGEDLGDRLRLTLERYFEPLSYRRLDFDLHHTGFADRVGVLFGDLLEPGWGRPRGRVRAKTGSPFGAPNGPPGERAHADWWHGHGRGFFALGRTEGGLEQFGSLFPLLDLGRPGEVLVIRAGASGPSAQIRRLREIPDAAGTTPMLGALVAEMSLARDEEFEVYRAWLPDHGIAVEVTPDSSFGRALPARRAGTAALEIVGLYLPRPQAKGPVLGVSVHLADGGRLRAHGLEHCAARLDILPGREAYLRQTGGMTRKLGGLGRRTVPRAVPGTSLTLTAPERPDGLSARSHLLLSSGNRAPMGWIALREGVPGGVGISEMHLERRPRWIGPDHGDDEEGALWLDWLDTTARLVVQDADGDTERVGLAGHLTHDPTFKDDRLRYDGHRVHLTRGAQAQTPVRTGDPFRLGPLRVRLHTRDDK